MDRPSSHSATRRRVRPRRAGRDRSRHVRLFRRDAPPRLRPVAAIHARPHWLERVLSPRQRRRQLMDRRRNVAAAIRPLRYAAGVSTRPGDANRRRGRGAVHALARDDRDPATYCRRPRAAIPVWRQRDRTPDDRTWCHRCVGAEPVDHPATRRHLTRRARHRRRRLLASGEGPGAERARTARRLVRRHGGEGRGSGART